MVRNGHLPAREILTGEGRLEIQRPRVRDNSPDRESRVRFSASVLSAYLRKSPAIEELIPWLYLNGISTGDFSESLQALVGEQANGLRACSQRRGSTSTTSGNLPRSDTPRRDVVDETEADFSAGEITRVSLP